jgi:protein ImuB
MADSLYACVYAAAPGRGDGADTTGGVLKALAEEFSPRYEFFSAPQAALVVIDVSGVERLLGPARVIGEELRRAASTRGVRAHVAVAATHTAARVLAHAKPGLTVSPRGREAASLAPLSIGALEAVPSLAVFAVPLTVFQSWGIRTLGDLAALPGADLVARFGRQALDWQGLARGEDVRPLVPTADEERFESTLDLEWPIDGLEPLSFVLTRLLEPLSVRLERRDRGAAVLHVVLRLVTREIFARRLELPAPMREVRALRTLALLDLESHPPGAAIDRVTVVIDPTPGRVVQHRLFTRAHPTPEQLSTLVARLGALIGQDRIGSPVTLDTYRPGAFAMKPFQIAREQERSRTAAGQARAKDPVADTGERDGARVSSEGPRRGEMHEAKRVGPLRRPVLDTREHDDAGASGVGVPTSALRRCRQPVPARVAVVNGRPVRVTTDRRGFTGGAVLHCAGPWRTSGHWWTLPVSVTTDASRRMAAVGSNKDQLRPVLDTREHDGARASGVGVGSHAKGYWDCDEWDVALGDGAVYRIFRDRESDAWFIDAIVD